MSEVLGYKVTYGDLVILLSSLTGIHYNFENIYYGIKGATSKVKAFLCLTPYLTVYLLIYLTSYSQFFEKGVYMFVAGIGFFQTYVTAYLNISSTANTKFPIFYIEPYLYVAILVMDHFRLIES